MARATLERVSVLLPRPVWEDLAESQAGVVARSQLIALGMTPSAARADLAAGRWQRLGWGVYLTHTGPVPKRAFVWAALLRAGPEAVAGPGSTLWLAGVLPTAPNLLDVYLPVNRRAVPAGVRVLRRRGLDAARHPVLEPPRLRLEEAVLDYTARLRRPEQVIDLVLRVTQRRLTTADRIAERLAARRAHRWRVLLREVLTDVADGVATPLERRYQRDVERAHGLPAAVRNCPEGPAASRRYRDARYPRYRLVVELDGREAHPDDERFRDRARDNRVALASENSLRYGWREVVSDPCGMAVEVALMLQRGGWTGTPRPCGPGCKGKID